MSKPCSLKYNVPRRGTLPSKKNIPEGSESILTDDEMSVTERKYIAEENEAAVCKGGKTRIRPPAHRDGAGDRSPSEKPDRLASCSMSFL